MEDSQIGVNTASAANFVAPTALKNERELAQIPRRSSEANPAKVQAKKHSLATLSRVL